MEGQQSLIPPNRRRWVTGFIVVIAFLFLGRLWWLQVYQGAHLDERARSRYLRAIITRAPRGLLLDRTGKVLATNEPSFSIALLPAEFSSDSAQPERIASLLGVSPEVLQRTMDKSAPTKSLSLSLSDWFSEPILQQSQKCWSAIGSCQASSYWKSRPAPTRMESWRPMC